MKYALLLIITSFSFLSISQNGEITVVIDERIEALIEKQSEIIPPATKPEIDGYRIQLIFDSDKATVTAARAQFVAMFHNIDTYVAFNAPNFILKVGDFRTHLEAEKVKSELNAEFPASFVIKEKINLPRLDPESNK